jgi:asparagine synthase (glutamine-hydrolysing)
MLWGEVCWDRGEMTIAGQGGKVLLSRFAEPGTTNERLPAPPWADAGFSLAEEQGCVTLFTGRIFNRQELTALLGEENPGTDAELVGRLYRKKGRGGIAGINGAFAVAIWEKQKNILLLARDHLGIEPLYYVADSERIIFSSALPALTADGRVRKELNLRTLSKFLLFNYNPGRETFFTGVHKLDAACFLEIGGGGHQELKKYWQPAFGETLVEDEPTIAGLLLANLRQAVARRTVAGSKPGIFLSGGMDSSTVLALLVETGLLPKSFSYTCGQKSFDESHHAQSMARQAGTEYHQTIFSDQDIRRMPGIVAWMNEPFCDLGINIATHLLGRAAMDGGVNYIFTGDGGDELFAGHPVYEADKLARYADRLPGRIKNSMVRLATSLPDCDKKKNWLVMAKRFAENWRLPADLLTHRWRIFYQPGELQELLGEAVSSSFYNGCLYQDIIDCGQQKITGDWLARSLYCDYHTVVDFYLRRNDLNRSLGLETCYPLLDYQLVDFCARIPSGLKIKKWFDTKHILKKAVKGVLPADILYRKDKLGHSIPLKNWLRSSKPVREFIFDYLSDAAGKRGLFRAAYINRLITEHLTHKRNNSHRLWGLAVLEMWLQQHYDRADGSMPRNAMAAGKKADPLISGAVN